VRYVCVDCKKTIREENKREGKNAERSSVWESIGKDEKNPLMRKPTHQHLLTLFYFLSTGKDTTKS